MENDAVLLSDDAAEMLPSEDIETDNSDSATSEESEQEYVESVQSSEYQVSLHPFMTTDFEDYTVTEGLLLVIVLLLVVRFVANILKEGFSWLK